jgi:hypothetical protein
MKHDSGSSGPDAFLDGSPGVGSCRSSRCCLFALLDDANLDEPSGSGLLQPS